MSRTNTLQIAHSRVKWLTSLSRQNHQNWTAKREIEQRSAGVMTLAMWHMARKWKHRRQSRRFTIVGYSVLLRGVYRHSGRFHDRVSTEVSIRMSTDNRSADIWPTLNDYSLSADSWSMFGRNIAALSPTKHRHTPEVSSSLVLHVVDTSVDCHFWMFRGFLLSKCHLEVSTWF